MDMNPVLVNKFFSNFLSIVCFAALREHQKISADESSNINLGVTYNLLISDIYDE